MEPADAAGGLNADGPRALAIDSLAAHPEALPLLERWFEAEWPGYYGPGGCGDAAADLLAYSNARGLPVGVIALLGSEPCGVAALRADSIPTHAHLCPWAVAGLVVPGLRGRGIGLRLLRAVEEEARRLGFRHIHCATATAAGLLRRASWAFMEEVDHDGGRLAIFRKAL